MKTGRGCVLDILAANDLQYIFVSVSGMLSLSG